MSKAIHIKFGDRIRALRAEHALTQEKLSQRAGISLYYVQLLEARKPSRSPSLSILERLAKAFDMEVWELLKFNNKG